MAPTRILVADDEFEIRLLVSELLEEAGYAVATVGDGLSALTAVRADPPALVLCDIAMPVMTGDEVLQHLLADGPPVPLIVMTAGTNPQRFLKLGAAAVVPKPFDLTYLLATVAETVARRPDGRRRGPGELRLPG